MGGVATSSAITTLNVGNRAITAVYNGNTSFNTSTSPALTQAVAKANATVGITSTANPSTAGQSVSFRATVTAAPPGTGTPTGTVQFVVDGSNFGTPVTLSGGVATSPATTTLTVANHTVTAAYGGSTNFNSSNSSTFTQTVSPCGGSNPIASENCLTGNPASEWDVSGVGDPNIQGFATDISVNRGETVSFKIDATCRRYIQVRHLPHGILRRHGSAESGYHLADHGSESAELPNKRQHRADRLRQLDNISFLGRPSQRNFRDLFRATDPDSILAEQVISSSSCVMIRARRTCSSKPPTPHGKPITRMVAIACIRATLPVVHTR